ncbi:InlB B-repeat-containing protein [Erysipelothrix aquatica]|uniref:InlB B-repeat-containing protein n=1 Tax=Erysipelothrix aquatica TaxID=2683714 RepID=UPI00135C69E8|nr:InlB B-repeat-containing protein [Erysipelothrix aquatica]
MIQKYNLLIDSHADEPMVPQKEGYEFDGWYRDDSFEKTSRWDFEFDTIQGNTTLYGKWRVVEVPIQMFTVTYQDGSDNESYFVNQIYDVAEGTTTPAYLGIPEREGYAFVGWSPEVANVVTQNVDYRAQWVSKSVPIQTFTVTYLDGSNNESFFVNQMYDVAEGTMTPHYVGTPKREGYTFAGWSPQVADVVTQDVEYIAQWQKEPVKPVEENREESSVESLPLTGTPHNSAGVLTMSSGAVLYLISVLKRKRNDMI